MIRKDGEIQKMKELVYLKSDEAVCDSLQIAEHFGKRHDRVLRAIDNLIDSLPKNGERNMFRLGSRIANDGQNHRMYYMNRDGFSLLVMGFTGKKALEWKLQYINAFNQMENFIKEKTTEAWIETRRTGKITRKAETDVIKQLVEYAKGQGSTHSQMLYMTYSRLANNMVGISDRESATVMQLNNMSLIENIILNQIRVGMEKGLHYKEIYKDCKRQIELFKDIAYLESVG